MAKGGLTVYDYYNLFDAVEAAAAAGILVTWNTCAQIVS